MGLREYQRKRDFTITAEPPPKRKSSKRALLFVIQKHDASRLHYDFRLELGGVLKSWAVPKGVPYKKGEKRLAMHVEDHPLDYARFEGIIPKGQYGGGTVMVWDIGTWEPLGGDPARDLEQGKLHLALHGKKLEGEWTLVAIRNAREENAWLLLKSGESIRPLTKKEDDASILTGRSMSQIAAEGDAVWQSNREEQKSPSRDLKSRIQKAAAHSQPGKKASGKAPKSKSKPQPDAALAHLPDARPVFVEPMKCKLADAPPQGDDWIYELKFDGFRALAVKEGNRVELISRNSNALTRKFPAVAEALQHLSVSEAVIDGEIVAMDEQGRSSFQLLQDYESNSAPPLAFYAFDLIQMDGKDLRPLPLPDRKKLLHNLLDDAQEPVRFSADLNGDPELLLSEVKRLGLEGIIGKRKDSVYETGRRSGAWIKLKCQNAQEFVIGGYTEPQGARPYFGALLVGYYENGKLLFATKVGTGFNVKTLRNLHEQFQPLRQEECPFVNLPTERKGRYGQGITRAEMKRCTWLRPELVCQVRFTEWTRDGNLRHPAFLGMREDKPAAQVVREQPAV
jgi:bifunctional non-homologous end joining protein LigD